MLVTQLIRMLTNQVAKSNQKNTENITFLNRKRRDLSSMMIVLRKFFCFCFLYVQKCFDLANKTTIFFVSLIEFSHKTMASQD